MNFTTRNRITFGLFVLLFAGIWIWQQFGVAGGQPIDGSIRIVDGDTVEIDGIYYRAENYDTPETSYRAECDTERALAGRATERLRQIQRDGLEIIPIGRQDRYERELARFRTANGRDIADVFVTEGLAVYWGNGPEDWCDGSWR